MKIYVRDVISAIGVIAPWNLAESWDNSGLQTGSPGAEVKKIGVSLDITKKVIDEAVLSGIDCLVTHHPFIFKALKNINLDNPSGYIISKSIKSDISIISAHTNFDAAVDGLNDMLGRKIGLQDMVPLVKAGHSEINDCMAGIGRFGSLEEAITLSELAVFVKSELDAPYIRVSGEPSMSVKKIALCTGSGGSLINDFLESGADVYISGDLKYHEAKDAEAHGKALLDIGHFASEIIMVDAMVEKLCRYFEHICSDVKIVGMKSEKEPFAVY